MIAVLTALMGALDAGSSDNVFIPMGIWIIILGIFALNVLGSEWKPSREYKISVVILIISFTLLAYNPFDLIVSRRDQQTYQELLTMLNSLDGNVYAPAQGQLEGGYSFHPAAHWVALEDMIRGPGRDTRDHPNTRKLLEPAIHPEGSAYILSNYPLGTYPWIEFLQEYYEIEEDFGDRFKPLRVLPARWDHGWPRYLYVYSQDSEAP
jgi:hypothetical protein